MLMFAADKDMDKVSLCTPTYIFAYPMWGWLSDARSMNVYVRPRNSCEILLSLFSREINFKCSYLFHLAFIPC